MTLHMPKVESWQRTEQGALSIHLYESNPSLEYFTKNLSQFTTTVILILL